MKAHLCVAMDKPNGLGITEAGQCDSKEKDDNGRAQLGKRKLRWRIRGVQTTENGRPNAVDPLLKQYTSRDKSRGASFRTNRSSQSGEISCGVERTTRQNDGDGAQIDEEIL